jgi:hypothetical protein
MGDSTSCSSTFLGEMFDARRRVANSRKNCHAELAVGGQQSNLGDRIEHLVDHPGARKGTVRNWPLAGGALLMVGALFACAVWGPRTHLQANSTKRPTVDFHSIPAIEGALHESSANADENNETYRAEIMDNVTLNELTTIREITVPKGRKMGTPARLNWGQARVPILQNGTLSSRLSLSEFPPFGQASFDWTREQLAALDTELQLLENELQDLRHVIGQSVGVEKIERLAARLSDRIDELQRHRELLFHELVKNQKQGSLLGVN